MKKERRFIKSSLKRDELTSFISSFIKFIRSFFSKNISVVKITSIFIVVIGLLLTFYFIKKAEENKKALIILSDAIEEYKKEKYENCLNYLQDIYTKYKASKYKGMSLYYSGNCYFDLGKYDIALEHFQKASSSSVIPLIKSLSIEGIAYCYEQKKEYKKAEDILLKLTKRLETSFLAPEVLFNLARCYEIQGKKQDAIKTYQEIINSYINSPWAKDSKIKLEMLKQSLP